MLNEHKAHPTVYDIHVGFKDIADIGERELFHQSVILLGSSHVLSLRTLPFVEQKLLKLNISNSNIKTFCGASKISSEKGGSQVRGFKRFNTSNP